MKMEMELKKVFEYSISRVLSGNHGKSRKKSFMHGKVMEFEKNLNNRGKIVEFVK